MTTNYERAHALAKRCGPDAAAITHAMLALADAYAATIARTPDQVGVLARTVDLSAPDVLPYRGDDLR